jgi:5-methyltetrahydrofolate--homocysteine methyltransferase
VKPAIYCQSPTSPSPQTTPIAQDGAKAPSRREGDTVSDNSEVDTQSLEDEKVPGYMTGDPLTYKLLKDFALEHRSKPTEAEEVLWNLVKSKQLKGYKFRRQHIIDRYIADLVCLDKRLIIEIDGLIHQLPDNKASDEARTIALNVKGFSVLRFTNEEVLNKTDEVLNKII